MEGKKLYSSFEIPTCIWGGCNVYSDLMPMILIFYCRVGIDTLTGKVVGCCKFKNNFLPFVGVLECVNILRLEHVVEDSELTWCGTYQLRFLVYYTVINPDIPGYDYMLQVEKCRSPLGCLGFFELLNLISEIFSHVNISTSV